MVVVVFGTLHRTDTHSQASTQVSDLTVFLQYKRHWQEKRDVTTAVAFYSLCLGLARAHSLPQLWWQLAYLLAQTKTNKHKKNTKELQTQTTTDEVSHQKTQASHGQHVFSRASISISNTNSNSIVNHIAMNKYKTGTRTRTLCHVNACHLLHSTRSINVQQSTTININNQQQSITSTINNNQQ